MNEMKTSRDGIEFIKAHEGFRATPYHDAGGLPTIGFGHLIKKGEVFGAVGSAEATQLLIKDVEVAEETIRQWVKTPLFQHQFDALVSFIYNLGSGAFAGSTLLKLINVRAMPTAITAQFERWDYCEGKPLQGLLKRRQDEAKLFNGGGYK